MNRRKIKIYQITTWDEMDDHLGYWYTYNKEEAMEDLEDCPEGYHREMYTYYFYLTKKSIENLLNSLASHPDNG